MANTQEIAETQENELKNLIPKRGLLKSRLTRFSKFLNSAPSNPTEIKIRLTKFESTWQEFDDVQSQIEILKADEAEENYRVNFEDEYFKIMATAENLVSFHNPRSSSVNATNTDISHTDTQVKLPTLKLPTFAGQYEQWLTFYDTFNSLIHENSTLNNIQKFHYLKSCLTGDAAQVIASLGVSGNNYEIAWQLLKTRFENKRLIVKNHVNALFNLPVVTRDSATSLRQLLDKVNTHLRALKQINLPIDSWDIIIIHLLTSKFDFATNKEWESLTPLGELPTMTEMIDFLSRRCQMLESLPNKPGPTINSQNSNNKPYQTINKPRANQLTINSRSHVATTNIPQCPICKQAHNIYVCSEFLKIPVETRLQEIKKCNLCINCLKANHQASCCYSTHRCRKCHKKHNTLLHFEKNEATQQSQVNAITLSTETASSPSQIAITNHCHEIQTNTSQVLLSTAIVHIFDNDGNIHNCRMLLDVGSQSNFLSESLCKRLQLKTKTINLSIAGITQSISRVTQSTYIKFKSRINSFTATANCLIVPKITDNLPSVTFPLNHLNIPTNLKLADPSFNVSSQIDLLIGAELFWTLMCVGQIKIAKNQPSLQKTQLGWIIGGTLTTVTQTHPMSCNVSYRVLEQQVAKLWEIEENHNSKILSADEAECESNFIKTHSRDLSGRFVVRLPFNPESKPLGMSKDNALKRLYTLENKLCKNSNLRESYVEFLKEYLELGHMELVPQHEVDKDFKFTFYLPHHAVIKESSLTTKVRVVFDGSAKSTSGVSLNDKLMVGPTIQQDLFSILTRFRTYQFAFTADVTKMYRQVLINSEDRDYQRILWRNNPDEPIKTYRLCTVTYGTASAPFLAVRCLNQLAHEEKHNYPLAHSVILRDFYVDDVLTGANTLDEAIAIRNELITVLASGGFDLCKFASNHQSLFLNNEQQSPMINLNRDLEMKTLGLLWNCKSDVFKYTVSPIATQTKVTKRIILSITSQIFDPLGLIGPVFIQAKIILQKLWSLKLEWDESVPQNIHTIWTQFINQLPQLNLLRIPRKVVSDFTTLTVEMHGFCDASESAYGACIYIRTTDKHKIHGVHLLCSKSRVAPLKNLSLPRLELCGALLLAQLTHRVCQTLRLNITRHYYWCDSTIVLSWIATASNKWKTFVANRVSEIQSLTNVHCWHHVVSSHNPADIISRGMSPGEITQSTLWWHGPEWLGLDSSNWPNSDKVNIVDNNITIERKTTLTSTIRMELPVLQNFSSYSKLQRVIAYCLRFIHNSKFKSNKFKGNLMCIELQNATFAIVKSIQARDFYDELNDLRKGRQVHKKSKLIGLNPFIDEKGLLRVGGRLRNSKLPEDTKHPIILPTKHHVTQLLIIQEHYNQLHGGPQLTLSALRHKFWPISARDTVRKIIHKCVICFRANPSSIEQMTGDLPKHRVEPARPFINCGVDYAGPILIKDGNGRSRKLIKAYIVLFVCFATKAVHLELVCDLTSQTFLGALRRFMSRRGKVSHMYSDNAKTFIGANRELTELRNLFLTQAFQTDVIQALTTDNIIWHFIPPRSPHFGGLWEAGIKSVKYHLKRIIGNASINYQEMYTLLTQIEACLNSRPLIQLSNSPEDLSVLTPAHFLIGNSINAPVEPDMTSDNQGRLARWQRIQQLFQHFWKRWSKEYLGEFQQRTKWKQIRNLNLKPGALVVLREENLPPLQWHMGRITQLHPGSDGITRVVSVKTRNGIVKRAITKVCILPIDDEIK